MSQQPEGSVEKKEVPEAGKGGATTKLQTSQRPSTTRGVQLATNRKITACMHALMISTDEYAVCICLQVVQQWESTSFQKKAGH